MLDEILGPLLIISLVVVVFIVGLGVIIWAIADAAIRDESQWHGAGQSKVLWIALIAGLSVALAPVGFVMAIVYLSAIRPRLELSAR